MNTKAKLVLAGACAAALTAVAGAAAAQPARATLYELPNYQGRSITIYRSNDNLANSDFNDRAQSAHFDGDWTVCTDAYFRGNCQTLSGDVANLSRYGLASGVSSLQQTQGGGAGGYGGGGGGGGYGGDNGRGYGDQGGDRGYGDRGGDRGYGDPNGDRGGGYGGGNRYGDNNDLGRDGSWGGAGGVRGRSVVFFARPQQNGQDIAAFDRSSADWFCRQQGLGAAVYYDTSFRSARAWRFGGGAFALNAPVLRDVVCRKQ